MRRSARTRWTAVNRLTGVLRRSRVLRTAHVEPVALFPSPSLPAAAAGERTRWGQLRTTTRPGVGEITAIFFFNDTARTEIYTRSPHDARPTREREAN